MGDITCELHIHSLCLHTRLKYYQLSSPQCLVFSMTAFPPVCPRCPQHILSPREIVLGLFVVDFFWLYQFTRIMTQ